MQTERQNKPPITALKSVWVRRSAAILATKRLAGLPCPGESQNEECKESLLEMSKKPAV